MIQKVFSVYDRAATAYLQPFFMPARGLAIRAFTDLCNDEKNQFSKHPGDYELFELGEYDDVAGKFGCNDGPVLLGSGNDFRISH